MERGGLGKCEEVRCWLPPRDSRTIANKGDMLVFPSIPHVVPHIRNKDLYLDLLRVFCCIFLGPSIHTNRKGCPPISRSTRGIGCGFKWSTANAGRMIRRHVFEERFVLERICLSSDVRLLVFSTWI
jgi:hypothetical protein